MRFRRSVQRYASTPEPETPYQRAGQLWDERIGSARVQARNWRLIAFGGFFLAAGMSAALVWQSLQSKVVPYVVAVDRLGEARAVSEAERDYQPTDAQVAWHLSRFIEKVRTVSLDSVLMRRDWLSAYDFVTRRGAQFLGDYARAADPFGRVGERTISVQVTSVVRASDRSFQVKWTETAFERGAEAGTSSWTGILTVIRRPRASAETLRRNPLGIYIDAIDWSRELEPAAAPTPAATVPESQPATLPSQAPVDPARDAVPASPIVPENQQ
ncbi:MAG: conjugal transfer protein TrbF [Sphingomonas sp.]|uniref:conjugal transfer protein TrbF n=1 Tax=Sphingomonas sp. TaxID=28214 RepID=UPI001B1703DA|nr:conjugal transfer protein TrbF [Sphingomonas sp.]MBO9623916.1 conjugal transfer protein TrbF [Sphingomonas sp.]